MTEGPPAAGASRAANSARVPAKFLLRHNARVGAGRGRALDPGRRARPADPGRRARLPLLRPAAAAGDSRRKSPAPLERVPTARSSAGPAEGPGGGAAVVYLRPRGRVTWARWNARLVAAAHSAARARSAPRPAPRPVRRTSWAWPAAPVGVGAGRARARVWRGRESAARGWPARPGRSRPRRARGRWLPAAGCHRFGCGAHSALRLRIMAGRALLREASML